MRQQDVKTKQLAQTVSDFIEPFFPYLIIGSKKTAEEACKKEGSELWELEKKLWGKLCSKENPELKEAAGDLVFAPSDPELKQVLVREVLKTFEQDPDFAKEISAFMEDELIQKMTALQQSSNDKIRVSEEFDELLEEFIAKKSTVQDSKRSNTGPGKEELMDKALNFASRILYGDARSRALSLIVPHLDSPEKGELIKKVLSSASNIHDEAERAAVLSSLDPHLRGPGKEELIENILDFAPYIQYGDAKFQIFSSLVPHLEGSGNEGSGNEGSGNVGPGNERLVEKALEMASGIQSGYLRVQALSLLIPYLGEQRKEETVEQALELASRIKDKNMRSLALSFVDPYRDGVGEVGMEANPVQELSFNEQTNCNID